MRVSWVRVETRVPPVFGKETAPEDTLLGFYAFASLLSATGFFV